MTIAGKTFTVTEAGSVPQPSGDYVFFAVIADTTGPNNSVWQSSMSLCNMSSSQSNAVLTYQYKSDKSVVRNVVIPPFGLVEWADTPVDLFNVSGKSSGVVTIEVDMLTLVAVRTFNSSVDGTFGQSLPGVSASQSMSYGQLGILSPIRRTPDFRTNIGVINSSDTPCTVNIHIVNKDGYLIGTTLTLNLAAREWKQISAALEKAGIDYVNGAYAVVELQSAGATVWAYATVIDNATGDPTALRMEIVE
jgi:hypothetical protein